MVGRLARRLGWICDVGIVIGVEGGGGSSREDLGPTKWHWPLHHHNDDPWAGSRLGLSRFEAGALCARPSVYYVF